MLFSCSFRKTVGFRTQRAGREERSCVGGMFREALIQVSEPGTKRREEDLTIESSD